MAILSIRRSKLGLRLQESYFTSLAPEYVSYPGSRLVAKPDLGLVFCAAKPGVHAKPMTTLLLDLPQAETRLWQGLRRNYRRDIVAVRDDFSPEVVSAPDAQALRYFCRDYNELAHSQKLPACNMSKLQAFQERQALIMTRLSDPADGQLLCTLIYIHNQRRTRLWFSVSRFRQLASDSRSRNQLAKAHRLLHWHDLLWFRAQGFQQYDFGGFALNASHKLQNINYFKQGFGGYLQHEFLNAHPYSRRGWLAMHYLLRKML
ncbi:MAG: hypothetical protein R3E95_17530 [Thiolinea sp.]